MHSQIIVNLPVADPVKSRAFFTALGYTFNADFTNDQCAMLVLGDNLFAMLMVRDFFGTFTDKPVADARTSTGSWVCLACDSRAEVDALVAKAVAAGGKAPQQPEDHGFMYGHGFEDLDGHHWQLIHMVGQPPKA